MLVNYPLQHDGEVGLFYRWMRRALMAGLLILAVAGSYGLPFASVRWAVAGSGAISDSAGRFMLQGKPIFG